MNPILSKFILNDFQYYIQFLRSCGIHVFRTVFVMDKSAPHFQVDSSFYNSQLRLGLPVNILSGKVWNSLRTFPVDIQPSSSTIDNLIKL